MIDDYTRTISTFVDGEPIEPDHLAAALEDPDARALLVDFVRMRAAVRIDDTPLPPSLRTFPALSERSESNGPALSERSESNGPALSERSESKGLRWPALAALLVLVFLAGLVVPRPRPAGRAEAAEAPPAPTRIEKFTPGVDWHPSN